MRGLVKKCARWAGLTGVHWSQFGSKEERELKNGRASQELHGGGDCFFSLSFFNLVLLHQKVLWFYAGYLIVYKNVWFLTNVSIFVQGNKKMFFTT